MNKEIADKIGGKIIKLGVAMIVVLSILHATYCIHVIKEIVSGWAESDNFEVEHIIEIIE